MAEREDLPGIPVSWPELAEAQPETTRDDLEIISETPELVASAGPGRPVSRSFGGPALSLPAIAVLDGPAECRPAFAVLRPFVDAAAAELASGIEEAWWNALAFHSFLNVARCCGEPLPADALALEMTLPAQLASYSREMDEPERHRLALAAVALGLTPLVPIVLGGGSTTHRFQPGRTFGFNVTDFVRYLAAAVEQGAPADAVEPAWQDFLQRFPRKLASGTLAWPDILWAGRAVLARLGGRPVEAVASDLHELVR